MEMEMRAMEGIAMAEDITPPLPPLTAALHNPFLHTHCSACFVPLPNPPIPSPNPLRYCSPKCSLSDPLSAAPNLPSFATADLRAALRLLLLLLSHPSPSHSPHRILGLLTNRDKFMLAEPDTEILLTIRQGAAAMAAFRSADSDDTPIRNALEEAVMCLVITNAVEVQDSNGRAIGIAVYDPSFSWINHSCSPNACYRFVTESDSIVTKMRISPKFCTGLEIHEGSYNNNNNQIGSNVSGFETRDFQGYGPRVIVRSIRSIRKGEAVTIAYCDLLQPKAMRQSELWSRYQFVCTCQRCSAKPLTYADHALQEISAVGDKLFVGSTSISNFDNDNVARRLNDYVDNAIDEYLSVGSPESCCEKLENLLTLGFHDEQEEEGTRLLNLRLHPLNYLSLNAYTTLASAYKVCSCELLASSSKTGNRDNKKHRKDASTMIKTSAAYSLFLAGANHHLFLAEPSLIASAANCWVVAGESLLILARRSSLWTSNISDCSFPEEKIMCSNCLLFDELDARRIHGETLKVDFFKFSSGISNCIVNISQECWSFLTHGCPYLKTFTDLFDFRWPETSTMYSNNRDIRARIIGCSVARGTTEDILFRCKPLVHSDKERQSIFELGIHCLTYGGYLASICYGHHSHLASQIQNILEYM